MKRIFAFAAAVCAAVTLSCREGGEMDVPYVEGRMPIEVWADIERRNGVSRFEVWPNGNCNDIFRLAVGIQEQCEPIKGRMWKNIAYEEFGCCIYDRLLDVEKILNDAEMNAHGR